MSSRKQKQYKQEKSFNAEKFFSKFCEDNHIICEKLDIQIEPSKKLREKFLQDVNKKRPDFWCKKSEKEIFVEVKTLTNITNQKRQQTIEKNIETIQKEGKKFGFTSEVFDPIPELKNPITTILKDASNKFKNIKSNINFPRILFINGIFGNPRFTTNAVFLGAYNSYAKRDGKLVNIGFRKKENGLLDNTGSNVSAIIYWNKDTEGFEGFGNPGAKVSFPEKDFQTFFIN